MNFERKNLNRRTGKFLEDNMQNQEEKDNIKKVMQGRSLQYQEANKLILILLTAMVVGDEEEEEEDEFQEVGEGQDGQSQVQNQTQSQSFENAQQAGSSGTSFQNRTQSQNLGRGEHIRKDFSDVCRFYKNGKCKFGKDCRKEHPEMCKKFRKQGLIRHNPGGCDGNCGKLHPNACRESLRNKECSRTECRFFHIKGTKNTASTKKRGREEQKQGRKTSNKIPQEMSRIFSRPKWK